jgi:hypothetical protein
MESVVSEYGLEEVAEVAGGMSEGEWKSAVDKRVEVVEQQRFRLGIQGKSKLELYGRLKKIGFEPYLAGYQRGGQR